MGLENYTRGQKIFFGGLVILLASTFTISGAMMVVLDSSARIAPSEGAKFDGDGIGYAAYQRLRSALYSIRSLDYGSSGEVESIYAKIPALSTDEILGYTRTGNPVEPRLVSLLDMWPTWQDQHVFCHLELARRARESGVEPPGNTRVGNVLFALMNAQLAETEKFMQRDLEREFRRRTGHELSDMMPTIREGMMVRDYVEALLAEKGATLKQVAKIVAGDNEEFRAEIIRLSVDAFMQRAMEEVTRESHAWRASRLAGGVGVSTHGFGYDAFEEAFDKNRTSQLQSDATFVFDVISAYPRLLLTGGKVPEGVIENFAEDGGKAPDRLQLTYLAVRDELYVAGEKDKTPEALDKRLDDALNLHVLRNPEETRNWTEDDRKAWKEKQRPELEKYRTYDEARGELVSMQLAQNSVPAAAHAISVIRRRLEDNRRLLERDKNATLEVERKRIAGAQGVHGYYSELRRQFTTMEDQVRVKMTPILARLGANPSGEELKRLAEDLSRAIQQLDTEQLGVINSKAALTGQNQEQQRDEKIALKEEFEARENPRNDNDLPMTAAEKAAKLQSFDLEAEAFTARIAARNRTAPLVEKVVAAGRALLAELDLAARGVAQEGDEKLRAFALAELLAAAPARLVQFVKDQGDACVPQSLVDQWDGDVQVMQADLEARQNAIRKEAADTRDLTLDKWCQDLGIEYRAGTRSMTWDDVLKDENLRELEFVEGAKSFLEDATNAAGTASGLLTLPGKGYMILRLRDKTPKYNQGRHEAAERAIRLAAMQRARRLAIDALEVVRRDVIKNGWDAAWQRASEKHGIHVSRRTLDWFNEKMDLPSIYSEADNDLLKFSTSPYASAPDQPFMTRLREIPTRDGVTRLIPEKFNPDSQRRPDREQWAYIIARVLERRPYARRMEESHLKETGYGGSPSELWRHRHLAGSEIIRELISPAILLQGRDIVLYRMDPVADNEAAN